jgi:hypothetical protein
VTLVGNPDGIAGTGYWKRRTKAKQRALGQRFPGAGPASAMDVPVPRAPTSATTSVDKP